MSYKDTLLPPRRLPDYLLKLIFLIMALCLTISSYMYPSCPNTTVPLSWEQDIWLSSGLGTWVVNRHSTLELRRQATGQYARGKSFHMPLKYHWYMLTAGCWTMGEGPGGEVCPPNIWQKPEREIYPEGSWLFSTCFPSDNYVWLSHLKSTHLCFRLFAGLNRSAAYNPY